MIIETLSVFPEVFDTYMNSSIMGRAQKKGALEFRAHDLRDWTHDKHRSTDDEIYGGGQGLLMMCPPIFESVEDLVVRACSENNVKPHVIFFAPWGKQFCEADALKLAENKHLIMVCGRYEGIDERAYTLADSIYSIGDYVLTGAELPAMVVSDTVVRLLDGVLGDEGSAFDESFSEGLLEYPQYTRPAEYRGMKVPDILLSGNHQAIDEWKKEQAIERTKKHRPDLLKYVDASEKQ